MAPDLSNPVLPADGDGASTAIIMRERRYAGLSAAQRRADRRARLLTAGRDLFGGVGYAATSIERLCLEAGVTTRHFYEEFPGREALLLAVYDEVLTMAERAVGDALAAAGPGLGRVRAGVEAYVRAMTADAGLVRIAYIETVGVSPAFEQRRRDALDAFARTAIGVAEELAAAGEIPRRDYDLTAHALAGAINELLVEWDQRPAPPSVERIVDELGRLYVAGLTAP